MQIKNGEILGLATQEAYRRGMRWYEAGLVTLLETDDDFFSAQVNDFPAQIVSIQRQDNHFITSCTCSHPLTCPHVVAALLQARDYYASHEYSRRAEKKSNGNGTPPATPQSRSWRELLTCTHHPGKVAKPLRLDPAGERKGWGIYFVLALGPQEWQITPYRSRRRKDGTYGAAYPTSIHEQPYYRVTCTQRENLALMMLDNYSEKRYLPPQYPFNGYVDRLGYSLEYGAEIGMLFDLLRDSEFFWQADHERTRPLQVDATPGRFQIHLENVEGGILLRPTLIRNHETLVIGPNTRLLSTQPAWVVHEDELIKVEGTVPRDFLLSLAGNPGALYVPHTELSEFFGTIERIPGLLSCLALPQTNHIPVIDHFTEKRLHLSEQYDTLVVRLAFVYGGREVESQAPETIPADGGEELLLHHGDGLSFLRVRRDYAAEMAAREKLVATGARQSTTGEFVLRESRALDWLLFEVPKLIAQGFVVLGEDRLKQFRVNRAQPQLRLAVNTEIDWFDCRLGIDFDGIALSLKELRKSLLHQTRYVKLSDGSTALLPEEWQQQLAHMFNLGEVESDRIKVSRYHLTLIDSLLEHADGQETDAGYRESRERLRHFKGIQAQPLPGNFRGTLRLYQQRGLDWLYFLQEFRFGGCLADDMGLGKTIQALALLQSEKNRGITMPSLIVCPTSALFNWQNELARFTPELQVLTHAGLDRRRVKKFDGYDVVLMSYGILRRDIEFLREVRFHYAILDESQHIKNPLSQTAKAARLLQANHRLVLTGTPVENNTQELWSQFQFLNPGLLGSLNYFRSAFARPIERERDGATASLLRRMIFPFILRRTKQEVAQELPAKVENLFYCDMLPEQRKLYERWRDYYRAHVMRQIDLQGLERSRMYVLEGLMRLRQICCHPSLIEQEVAPVSGKFDALNDLLENILAEEHKVLVFSQFVRMLRLICRRLDEQGIPYAYLDGHTRDRQSQVDRFQNDPRTRVFLISLKAGGFSLNLTAADYVILYDPWWNPAAEAQAIDRTHRIGQEKNVFAYKLIVRNSVEEKILQLQERKRALVADLITTDAGLFKHLSAEDIAILFS
ncbi:MAG: SNF2 family helicase [candidate division KSB1 bacterium]|nr:SNF2 family helicase [candidate division KSB1 bacterium]MDZ7276555.1 SNF2 family helicase [candidate division KSB1 bacterium]MDZ7285026.1 SNF2 family helicase [candidate division KSB1 bacterium]MDZ7298058.1 SNF2 family helicase [candidate division KSB1 bacterium]MDZ7307446.1 SNF2 family helicase [candidate division KSB1 bacterium]